MIGKKTLQQKSFYGISLEQLVPEDNFYRRLDAELNLDFIYPFVKPGIVKRMSKIRSRKGEPVLGTLLNFMGMKRVNTRGIKGAEKHVLMAALCYNLKKYMAFVRKNRITKPAVMIREHAASYYKNRSDLVKRILVRNAPFILGY